jgi:hypothetical protein
VDRHTNPPFASGNNMGKMIAVTAGNVRRCSESTLRLFVRAKVARHVISVVLVCWIAVVAIGVGALVAYSQTPGPTPKPPTLNIFGEQLAGATNPWWLIAGIHPKCRCTLATMSELQRIMRQGAKTPLCSVVVFVPTGSLANWTDTTTVRQARATPGVEVIDDLDGRTLKSLGIQALGAAVLYDSSGTPQFRGGITRSRGHEGVNLGVESILALINGRPPLASDTSIYGCRIAD